MRMTLLIGAASLLAACETIPQAGAGRCNAAKVARFTGALATSDLGTTILRESRARTMRWIAPGTAVTMDYRGDRVNVRLDGRNFVTGVDCG